nr:hypothetical protein [Nocardia nova]
MQQRQNRMPPLPLGQGTQRGLETRQPVGVVGDASDAVTVGDEPVDEGVQADAVVVRVEHVEGVESAVGAGAERGDGGGGEVRGKAVVVGAGATAVGGRAVERFRCKAGGEHAEQQPGEQVGQIELPGEFANSVRRYRPARRSARGR